MKDILKERDRIINSNMSKEDKYNSLEMLKMDYYVEKQKYNNKKDAI